jgi:PAS domain S-box-containing protein
VIIAFIQVDVMSLRSGPEPGMAPKSAATAAPCRSVWPGGAKDRQRNAELVEVVRVTGTSGDSGIDGVGPPPAIRRLLDALPGLAYRCRTDSRWTMLFASAGSAPLTGYQPGELTGDGAVHFVALIHPDDRDRVEQEVAAALAVNGSFRLMYRMVTRSGELKWVWEHGHQVEGEADVIEGFIQDISPLKNTEESLESERALLEESQRLASVGSWVLETATGRVRWSAEMYRIFGLEPTGEDQYASELFEMVHPDDRERTMATIEEATTTATSVAFSYRVVRPDGQLRLLQGRARVVTDPAGRAVRVSGIAQDVTGREAATRALAESHARFRCLVEASTALVWRTDAEGNPLDDHAAWICFTGLPEDELGRDRFGWIRAVHPDDRSTVLGMVHRAFETQRLTQFSTRVRRRDGEWRDMRVYLAPLAEDGAPVAEWVGAMTDISEQVRAEKALKHELQERRQAEEALRESERKLAEAQRIGKVGSFSWDMARNATSFSREAVRLLGTGPAAAIADSGGMQAFLECICPEDRPSLAASFERVIAARAATSKDTFRVAREDGVFRTFQSVAEWEYDSGGHPLRVTGTLQDVTQQRALEEQLRQSQKMEAIGRLAGGVAHDFNNLLTVILGHTELLLEAFDPEDPRRDDLQEVLRAAGRGGDLTRQLLTFSRQRMVQPKQVDLAEVVEDAYKMLRRLVGEDVELAISHSSGPVLAMVDPGQLEQVLVNLVVNARDAMPNGGRLSVTTARTTVDAALAELHPALHPGDYVVLAVSDSGHGMSSETRARIFEPFFTTKEAGRGTGLGLATVFGIVEQAGGHTLVYSEVGAGTTFKVYLPSVKTGVAAAAEKKAAPAARGHETILLVEDDDTVRRFARRALESQGYRIVEAASAARALALEETHTGPLDLLLTDVVMPGANGRELAEAIESRRPGLPVLFTSGYTPDVLVHHRVSELGAPFLEKPFSSAGLAAAVRQALDRPRIAQG